VRVMSGAPVPVYWSRGPLIVKPAAGSGRGR
jgi:hypothetical protein